MFMERVEMRLWPRRYIQPDYASVSRRRAFDDCGLGDTLALGLFLLVGMFVLGWTAIGWHDASRDDQVSHAKVTVSDRVTVKAFARIEPAAKRRVRPTRLAMARQSSR